MFYISRSSILFLVRSPFLFLIRSPIWFDMISNILYLKIYNIISCKISNILSYKISNILSCKISNILYFKTSNSISFNTWFADCNLQMKCIFSWWAICRWSVSSYDELIISALEAIVNQKIIEYKKSQHRLETKKRHLWKKFWMIW